ncbi:cofactor-independent phosphoglycerate mutase [Vallitalea guaymasensis]|uniref:Cofactor-independent phosphoglycerate mutase n=1 Tax=Vallitalea guaymasensis TaxID=1185412 RepID=A0A8J8MCJ6_9FIRM|nr:cofactor-independent phosphoglycerate mutase [Vallitalea guaymasensis]QUH30185.1 cofactor-independent phosphoglycerate mutase [Vallitalea guaymasensis]
MKYVLILGDGMADEPVKQLGDKTPLQVADKENIDSLARIGEVGLVKTIPDGLAPGSDTANLSVLGYDPQKYYTGRSPLEALSIGADMESNDVSFRCNLVTLSEDGSYEDKTIIDHSSDEITTEEADELIKYLEKYLGNDTIKFYTGTSYRHAIIWHKGSIDVNLTPPHDILEKNIKKYLPKGTNSDKIKQMMVLSNELLKNHPINIRRKEKGLRPANSIWIWGEGTKPTLKSFRDKYNKKGAMISAVDLLKGIAIAAEMKNIEVEGVTGNINTNFEGKAKAAIDALKSGQDFVYVHMEAPDECGHRGEIDNKVKSIELIDSKVVKYIKEELDKLEEDYKIMILPDHPTPLAIRTHTNKAVPYLIYDSSRKIESNVKYDEESCKTTGNVFMKGYELMDYFLK